MDRLYVNEADGPAIGWLDLETGERVTKLPVHVKLFERKVAEWLSEHPEANRSPTIWSSSETESLRDQDQPFSLPGRAVGGSQTAVADSQSDSDEPWVDLAKNFPGQAVKARAIAVSSAPGRAVAFGSKVTFRGFPRDWDGACNGAHYWTKHCQVDLNDVPPATVISAHGAWYIANGVERVPAGDDITTYVPIGTLMGDDLGEDIDTGNVHGDDSKYLHTYPAGTLIPNFTFMPLEWGGGKHVLRPNKPTTLNNLISPGEGSIWIAACASVYAPAGEGVVRALSTPLPVHTPGTDKPQGYARVGVSMEDGALVEG
jgi:hypothetical protein